MKFQNIYINHLELLTCVLVLKEKISYETYDFVLILLAWQET